MSRNKDLVLIAKYERVKGFSMDFWDYYVWDEFYAFSMGYNLHKQEENKL